MISGGNGGTRNSLPATHPAAEALLDARHKVERALTIAGDQGVQIDEMPYAVGDLFGERNHQQTGVAVADHHEIVEIF
jgi:hypothetical protein